MMNKTTLFIGAVLCGIIANGAFYNDEINFSGSMLAASLILATISFSVKEKP